MAVQDRYEFGPLLTGSEPKEHYMYPFRVFISYSREDLDLAKKLVDGLRGEGLKPYWDEDIGAGAAFSEEIKGLIANSHVFMPLITDKSKNSPWVHQETGFAIALRIPVIPIILEDKKNMPDVLIASLQAIVIEKGLDQLGEKLREANLEELVIPLPARPTALKDIAEWPEKRTELLIKYTDRELRLGNYGKIRQKAAYSSFYIPTDKRDGDHPRSEYYHFLLSEERRTLGQHLDHAGCKLIIDPFMKTPFSGRSAAKSRLEELISFLESMDDKSVEVVTSHSARRTNLTIVGDWFSAESRIPSAQGYRNTIFDFHAPTVLRLIRQFDEEFRTLYNEQEKNFLDGSSRLTVIKKIKEFVTLELEENNKV